MVLKLVVVVVALTIKRKDGTRRCRNNAVPPVCLANSRRSSQEYSRWHQSVESAAFAPEAKLRRYLERVKSAQELF